VFFSQAAGRLVRTISWKMGWSFMEAEEFSERSNAEFGKKIKKC